MKVDHNDLAVGERWLQEAGVWPQLDRGWCEAGGSGGCASTTIGLEQTNTAKADPS
jgi:hypothetical protein